MRRPSRQQRLLRASRRTFVRTNAPGLGQLRSPGAQWEVRFAVDTVAKVERPSGVLSNIPVKSDISSNIEPDFRRPRRRLGYNLSYGWHGSFLLGCAREARRSRGLGACGLPR